MLRAIAHDPVLHLTLRAALALLFASTALHKARDVASFRETLRAYRIVPDPAVPVATGVALGAELLVAVALLVPGAAGAGALGASALLAVYAAAIGVNLARGRRAIDCGCGGPGARQPISGWLVWRNVVLVGVALATVAPVHPRPLLWLDWVTLTCAVGVLALAWDAAHRLRAEWARMRPHLQPATEAE